MACDMSQYVMVDDPMRCVAITLEASGIENEGMLHDKEGRVHKAVNCYGLAAARLGDAVEACPEGHPDFVVLQRHAAEVRNRATYLSGLNGIPATVPLEEHIHGVQLTLGVVQPGCATAGVQAEQKALRNAHGPRQVMGVAAAFGAATGVLALGPVAGIALGATAAYASTCDGRAGAAARGVGVMGVRLAVQASILNKEHKITKRVATATLKTHQALSTFNKEHRVTEKLGQGIATAFSRLVSSTNA